MKKLKYILPALLALGLFAACSDDDDVDTTAPVIEIISPEDHEEFHPGETIHLHAIITDDTELASWKVEIHFDGDGHTHSKVITLKNGEDNNHEIEWQFQINGNIEGNRKDYELIREIQIPENAKHGEYHLGVYAIDQAGNQSEAYIEIEIEDDEH